MATAAIPIQTAYTVARRVFLGELALGAGSKLLNSAHGINRNSARDLIAAYKHLVQGDVFHRGLSAPDMDYYLSCIRRDSGTTVLRIALQSLWKHIGYYEGVRKVTCHKLRGVAAKHEAWATDPVPADVFEANFAAEVKKSLSASTASRAARLLAASKKPNRIPVMSLAFARNPDVVAQVLIDANGHCARCKNSAPFNRKSDNSPYLEGMALTLADRTSPRGLREVADPGSIGWMGTKQTTHLSKGQPAWIVMREAFCINGEGASGDGCGRPRPWSTSTC